MKKKYLEEKNFLNLSLIMIGIVMIFSSINSIILSCSMPEIPQRKNCSGMQRSDVSKRKLIKNSEQISAAESIVCEQNVSEILPNMKSMYEKNHDMVGWIKIENTAIDYPVMFTPNDGEFYLYKNFYKNKDINGSIFIDEHCKLEPRCTNLIFHGHNMKNGSMFAALMNYKSQKFYSSHKEILFDTLYENQKYQILSVFMSKVYNMSDNVFKYYRFYNATNEEEFDYFYNNIKQLSLYDTGVAATYGDEFITLSTCDSSIKNGRFVVVAKRSK